MNNFRDVLFVLVQNMKIRRNEGLDFDFSSNFDVRIVCADGKPVFCTQVLQLSKKPVCAQYITVTGF